MIPDRRLRALTSCVFAATHVDTGRAILDFLRPHHTKQIIIGESAISKEGTFDGYKNYGYLAIEKEYNVKLIDLDQSCGWRIRDMTTVSSRQESIDEAF